MQDKTYDLKPLFEERIKNLLNKDDDFKKYVEILKIPPEKSFRCNKLKISPEELKKRLEKKGWKIKQPWKNYPEVMIAEGKSINKISGNKKEVQLNNNLSINKLGEGGWGDGRRDKKILIDLEPGELGRALEHLLGYYYIQELASMLPVIALKPKENEIILDLCAAPGSKTSQLASEMNNTGTIIANDISLRRLKILSSNLERCGVTNTIITKKDGLALCNKFKEQGIKFDKILLDAPCSGEGTLRSSPRTYIIWNINTVKKLSKIQKNLLKAAFEILKKDGEIVYSTCTHSPEENEEVVDFALKEFGDKIKIESISLPIKCRQGVCEWENKEYDKEVKNSYRIYPHDANTEGFFIAKFRRIK